MENFAWKRGGMKKEEDRKIFEQKLELLFNITSCTHDIVPCVEVGCEGCEDKAHTKDCNCRREKKIPRLELSFMMAMKVSRPPGSTAMMMMVGPDIKETKKQEKAATRKTSASMARLAAETREKEMQMELSQRCQEMEKLLQEDETEETGTTNEDTPASIEKKRITSKYNTLKIPNTALATIRTDATNRQAAAITSGFLEDLIAAQLLPAESQYLALDQKKIHRAREEVMGQVQEEQGIEQEQNEVKTIMIDSRITKTKVRVYNEETKKFYTSIEKADIYTMTDGDGKYLNHFIKEKNPENSNMSSSQALALQVFEWCTKYGVDDTLKFIAGDSTNSNTGYKGGLFHYLEVYLNRRLFWIVCQLHTNELKFRRLISKRDGKTNSKDGWQGDLGKMLPTVRSLERNPSYEAIPGTTPLPDLPQEVVKDLSSDQHYSYKIAKAIRSGQMDKDLAALTVGQTGHSRWLTTANLFCDWWCRDHGLDGELLARLKEIVTFLTQVYIPCWFQVKIHNKWIDGPKNVLFELSCIRTQSKVVQLAVMPTVRSSAWYAHSESILVTMLCSEEEEERRFAALTIISIRGKQEMGDTSVRLRKLPYLNIKATTLKDLIDWDGASEPIITARLTNTELLEFVERPMEVESIPCHTQAIERAVKEVTAAAGAVCGAERRDGFIRGRAKHIEMIPKMNSKKDFIKKTNA